MQLTVLSWNLFHGRDFPPDPALFTWRSRLLGTSERNATHVQVNRELLDEFAALLAAADWDVALLQECPPRWWQPLAAACDAEPHGALTSRNSLGAVRAYFAAQNPDLLAAAEGGSNLTLVRNSFRCDFHTPEVQKSHRNRKAGLERRELTIHEGRPERRAMAFTRLAGDAAFGGASLCVANLHATNDRPPMASADVLRAAEAANEWAGESPLVFGGDLNLRPAETPAVFERAQRALRPRHPDRARRDRPRTRPRAGDDRTAACLAARAARAARGRARSATLRPRPRRSAFCIRRLTVVK